ncbi:BTAD domain-containing putative transcriptional regulator [Streptomyces sp. 184]|uniref:AfsR/SARP family transcriptional regulator n=1 Tax=Streptomyces sp. 184 TaxID=1827526 RepID=UPI0038918CB9
MAIARVALDATRGRREPRLSALLRTRVALGHSITGQRGRCGQSLHRAEQELDRASPQPPPWLAFCGPAELTGQAALCHYNLGDFTPALQDDDPPASARTVVATYAYRLRKCLGHDTLVREPGRYRLRIQDSELDLALAAKLASSAETAVAEGDAEGGRDRYAAALQSFTGEPLAGLPGPYAERHRERLSRWRRALLERRLELDLATGHHDEAVEALTDLTAADPLSDRLRELLALARHRSRTER